MESKQIRITIDLDGNCQAEGLGFRGPECDRLMREIDAALGTRTSTKYKAEHAMIAQQQKRTNTNG